MWQTIRKQTYRMLYLLGKEPPSSDEVEAELQRLQQESKATAENTDGARRGCQVMAGNNTVGCYPNILVHACDFIGDAKPGLTGVQLPLRSCENMPTESS